MVKPQPEPAKQCQAGLTLAFSEFPPADEDCECVGYFQRPKGGHFERSSFRNGI